MSDKDCPAEGELLAFADADLSPERSERVDRHLKLCSACAKQVAVLSLLIEDIAAPVADVPLDVAEHVASVTKRLDSPVRVSRRSPWTVWGSGLAAAVASAAALVVVLGRPDVPRGHLEARGSSTEAGLPRDIGVQLYALDPSPRPLESGHHLRAGTPLTAGLRNLGSRAAYLLLFGVDSQHAVHWIAPTFTTPGTDPGAVPIVASSSERLLPSAAAFDDLSPGPLRVVALITSEPTRVSDVEALSADDLSSDGLAKRFPGAEIRQVVLEAFP